MSQFEVSVVFTAFLVAALLATIIVDQSRRAKRARSAQVGADLVKALEATEIACADMKRELAEQRAQTEAARAQRDAVQRERDNLGLKIDGILEERETWRKKYLEESAGAASAQDMMLFAIERLSRQLVSLGASPKIGPALRAVLDEISLTDGTPPMTAVLPVQPTSPVTAMQPAADPAQVDPVTTA